MDVLSPVRPASSQTKRLAPRPPRLRGCRVGILDNSKPNAGTLLGHLADLLVERHGAVAGSRWQKPGASRPAANLDEVVRAADVVLTGSGD